MGTDEKFAPAADADPEHASALKYDESTMYTGTLDSNEYGTLKRECVAPPPPHMGHPESYIDRA